MNPDAQTAGTIPAGGIEAFIRIAHRVARHGRYHPYFLASDLGLIVTLGLTAAAGNLRGTTDWWRLAAPLVVFHLIGYPLYLKLKLKVVKTPARSFLQDTLLFILPGYLLAMLALGVPMRTATDYLALCLPVTLAFHRIGCLVGGCCYGRPTIHGISYDPDLVTATHTPWRRFDPGPAPAGRVFPLQLTDAAVNIAIAAVLYTLAHSNPPMVPLLPLYLAAYSAARLIMEPFRGHRHRPLYGHVSEAQLTAFLVTTLSALWIGLALALLARGTPNPSRYCAGHSPRAQGRRAPRTWACGRPTTIGEGSRRPWPFPSWIQMASANPASVPLEAGCDGVQQGWFAFTMNRT